LYFLAVLSLQLVGKPILILRVFTIFSVAT
jgi:hypothetical protein